MFPITRDQIETPALLVDLDILEENIKLMSEFMKDKSSKLRPHFKTYKCPIISHMQIAANAKGITCSKLEEAEVLVGAGIKDILIANQVVEPSKIYRLAGLANGGSKISVLVDNSENISVLSKAASQYGSTIYVLIEIDVGMKRCGVENAEEVLVLTKQILSSEGLVFNGLQAYHGPLEHVLDMENRRKGVEDMIDKVNKIKNYLEENGIHVNEISGSGTGTHNITGNNTIWTEIQAGSYVFMDHEYSRLNLEFNNALSVLTTVIHKRNGMAVTDAGLKVCSEDQGQPIVKEHPELSVVLNEEHGIIRDEFNQLKYMEKIEYIPSHCCSTVNLHDTYYCIRNGILETTWPILGRGKSK